MRMKKVKYVQNLDVVGGKYFFKDPHANKILHRTDGPAVEYPNGDKYWYVDGVRHRDDGPAVEYADGTKHWYKDGLMHREGGPAIQQHGTNAWFRKGVYHRLDGPAVEYIEMRPKFHIRRSHYVNGVHYKSAAARDKAAHIWLSYREVSRDEISLLIGNFRIVEW